MNGFFLQALAQRLGRYPHLLLLGHLAILHALVFGGWHLMGVRLLWPVAVGLLLLWQPFIEGERELSRGQGAMLMAAVVVLMVGMNPWFLLIWCGALAAVIGGRVFWSTDRRERMGYLLAFGYLICLCILGVVPEIAPRTLQLDPLPKSSLATYLPLLLPLLILTPAKPVRRRSGDAFDFFYSLLVFLVLAVFVLGILAHMLVTEVGYLEAVVHTSLTLAGALLVLAWAWNPRGGFAGIGSALSRYLLSVGMPLEQWLLVLNEESEKEASPERFLAAVLARLQRMPWVVGGEWQVSGGLPAPVPGQTGHFGQESGHPLDFRRPPVRIRLFLGQAPSPAMGWHLEWLLRLATEYYLVKSQHRELERMAYLQAVYETGARVTHDVKNLLQSMQTLCFAAAQPGEPEALARLLGRQLPLLTERLRATLDKLQQPRAEGHAVAAEGWWAGVQERYAGQGVGWNGMAVAEVSAVPGDLFDGVVENLLQNALAKRQREPGLAIEVCFDGREPGGVLTVSDDGSAIPAELAAHLLQGPVRSEDGLGIGLYHVARHAEEHGYDFSLARNEPGAVVFMLKRS